MGLLDIESIGPPLLHAYSSGTLPQLFDKRQELGVDLVFKGRAHAMRCAFVDFESIPSAINGSAAGAFTENSPFTFWGKPQK